VARHQIAALVAVGSPDCTPSAGSGGGVGPARRWPRQDAAAEVAAVSPPTRKCRRVITGRLYALASGVDSGFAPGGRPG